jgi:hypothetical protein
MSCGLSRLGAVMELGRLASSATHQGSDCAAAMPLAAAHLLARQPETAPAISLREPRIQVGPTVSRLPHRNENCLYVWGWTDRPRPLTHRGGISRDWGRAMDGERWFILIAMLGLVGFLATAAWVLAG